MFRLARHIEPRQQTSRDGIIVTHTGVRGICHLEEHITRTSESLPRLKTLLGIEWMDP